MMEIFASWVNGDGQITPWSSRRRLWLEPAQPATQQMDHEAEQHQTRTQSLQRSGVLIEQDGSRHHADAGHQQGELCHLGHRITHQQAAPQAVTEPGGDKGEIEHAQEPLPAEVEQAGGNALRPFEQPGQGEERQYGHQAAQAMRLGREV